MIEKGKVPIVVGGTGLYIESLLYSVSHSGEAEPNFELRDELEEYAKKNSNQELRSEEHTSELQSRGHLVCRLLLEKKKKNKIKNKIAKIINKKQTKIRQY